MPDSPDPTPTGAPPIDPVRERAHTVARALKRYRSRLKRKRDAMAEDLAEVERAPLFRRYGEALLAFLRQVPPRAATVSLPDPADEAASLEIELDPNLNAQGNATRYFRRAAKAERGLEEIPRRIASVERELAALDALLARVPAPPKGDTPAGELPPELARDLESALEKVPAALRTSVGAPPPSRISRTGAVPRPGAPRPSGAGKRNDRAPSARLQPRRLKTTEGWDVLIGRNNEGNDYLTHHLARPEDYWMHVHGAAGSHVVIRRGKGKNEPSKQTIEEVAAWAAFYSQARTAGRVPVIVTQKKYVRKPRKAPPGLVVCEREKTVMARPVEPPRESLADFVEEE